MPTVKEYVKQYTNESLAAKWNNNIPLSELDNLEFYCTDSQDIDFICEYFSFLPKQVITGYVASYQDGDFRELYVTESARPYDLQSIYHPLEYYL